MIRKKKHPAIQMSMVCDETSSHTSVDGLRWSIQPYKCRWHEKKAIQVSMAWKESHTSVDGMKRKPYKCRWHNLTTNKIHTSIYGYSGHHCTQVSVNEMATINQFDILKLVFPFIILRLCFIYFVLDPLHHLIGRRGSSLSFSRVCNSR